MLILCLEDWGVGPLAPPSLRHCDSAASRSTSYLWSVTHRRPHSNVARGTVPPSTWHVLYTRAVARARRRWRFNYEKLEKSTHGQTDLSDNVNDDGVTSTPLHTLTLPHTVSSTCWYTHLHLQAGCSLFGECWKCEHWSDWTTQVHAGEYFCRNYNRTISACQTRLKDLFHGLAVICFFSNLH